MTTYYIACDLGAESGRVMAGTLNNGKLTMSELHRFPNNPIQDKDSLSWDIPQLFQETLVGLRKVAQREDPIAGVSCDSWGVDYMLFEADGSLIAPTYHYRDPRSAPGMKDVLAKVSWETIYAETGIQKMPMNTLFQLGAEKSRRFSKAHHLLSVADGFNFLLSGAAKFELSMASTIRIAAETARFGQPEVKIGVMPGYGGTQRLPRLIGRGRALQLILSGEIIDAQEAYRIGLVNAVLPQAELLFLPEAAQLRPGRSIAGLRISVRDLQATRRIRDADLELRGG